MEASNQGFFLFFPHPCLCGHPYQRKKLFILPVLCFCCYLGKGSSKFFFFPLFPFCGRKEGFKQYFFLFFTLLFPVMVGEGFEQGLFFPLFASCSFVVFISSCLSFEAITCSVTSQNGTWWNKEGFMQCLFWVFYRCPFVFSKHPFSMFTNK